jgi:hypothetical protein
MGTARIHEGVRQMRFEGLLDRQTRGEITQEEAATCLGLACGRFIPLPELIESGSLR